LGGAGDLAGGTDGQKPGDHGQLGVGDRVRADLAALDPVLYRAVLAWLERDWPFRSIEYAPRT